MKNTNHDLKTRTPTDLDVFVVVLMPILIFGRNNFRQLINSLFIENT